MKWWTGASILKKALVILGASATTAAGATGGYLTYQELKPKGRMVALENAPLGEREALILVHGKLRAYKLGQAQNPARVFAELKDNLEQASAGRLSAAYKLFRYEYNDSFSAEQLGRDLVRQLKADPELRDARLRFVAHSYGGLVAREGAALVNQQVVQINTLGSPHHGVEAQIEPWISVTAYSIYSPVTAFPFTVIKTIMFDYDSDSAKSLRFDDFNGAIPKVFKVYANQHLAEFNRRDANLGKVFAYAGQLPKKSKTWLERNRELWEAATTKSLKDYYDLLSLVIQYTDGKGQVMNDGLVSVESASAQGLISIERTRKFAGLNHTSLVRSRAVAKKLWQDLSIPAVQTLVASEDWDSLLKFPDLPEIDLSTFLKEDRLSWAHFLFVRDGALWGADSNWQQVKFITKVGDRLYQPRTHQGKILLTAEYKGVPHVYLVGLNGLAKRVIEPSARMAAWSPDGKSVVYEMEGRLVRHHLNSGTVKVLVEGVTLTEPPLWTGGLLGGKIYFITAKDGKTPLYAVSDRASKLNLLTLESVLSNVSTAVNLNGNILAFSLGYEASEKDLTPYAEAVLVKARLGLGWLKHFRPRIQAGRDFSFNRGNFTMPYFRAVESVLWDKEKVYLTVVLDRYTWLVVVDQKAFKSAAGEVAEKAGKLWEASKRLVKTGEVQDVDMVWRGPSWSEVVPLTVEGVENLIFYR